MSAVKSDYRHYYWKRTAISCRFLFFPYVPNWMLLTCSKISETFSWPLTGVPNPTKQPKAWLSTISDQPNFSTSSNVASIVYTFVNSNIKCPVLSPLLNNPVNCQPRSKNLACKSNRLVKGPTYPLWHYLNKPTKEAISTIPVLPSSTTCPPPIGQHTHNSTCPLCSPSPYHP